MRSSEALKISMGSSDAVCSVMMSTYEKASGPLTNGDVNVDLGWEMAVRASEARMPGSTCKFYMGTVVSPCSLREGSIREGTGKIQIAGTSSTLSQKWRFRKEIQPSFHHADLFPIEFFS